jgi:hypothetical protein
VSIFRLLLDEYGVLGDVRIDSWACSSVYLLPNDLVSFSSHAGRKIVKQEDVMLMARKDKKCVGADLKKKMMEMQTRNKNDGKKTGKKSISPRRRKSDSERSTSPAGRKKTTKPAKKSTKATKSKNVSKRSNAAKQNPESFSSDSSGDEENALATMCQRVADMQRKKVFPNQMMT